MADKGLLARDDDTVIAFGEEENVKAKAFNSPGSVLFHFFWRVSALIAYLFCGWFSDSYITSFVVIVTLLSLDFWTVKNITGRLLAGLRWWNYVDDEGKSHWVFERRKANSMKKVNANESRLFWVGLIVVPLFWVVFFFGTLFTLNFKWLLVTVVGISLNSANIFGYLRCSVGSTENIKSAASTFLGQQVLRGMLSKATTTPAPATTTATT